MSHLEEGTIHAWLDGALPPDESARAEAHVAACPSCAAAVADARGMIAAASRILTALDDVPGDVIPVGRVAADVTALDAVRAARARARTRSWTRRLAPVAAVAAMIVVAVLVAENADLIRQASTVAEDKVLAASDEAVVPETVSSPPSAPAPVAMPPAEQRAAAAPGATLGATGRGTAQPAPAAASPSDALNTSEREQRVVSESERVVAGADVRQPARSDAAAERSAATRNEVAEDLARRARTPAIASAPRPSGIRGAATVEENQAAQISGRVTDPSGSPVANATVIALGTDSGAMTDEDGSYRLNVPPGKRTLQARRLGYASSEQEVDARAGEQTSVDLALGQAGMRLEDVTTAAAMAPRAPTPRRIAGLTLSSTRDTIINDRPARRSTYRLASGQEITMLELTPDNARGKMGEMAKQRAAPADAPEAAPARDRAAVNTLWWVMPDGSEITLFGAVSIQELERIRALLR